MRQLSLIVILFASVIFFAGCLKDDDFDNDKYGIIVGNIKGVSFPQSVSSPLIFGINSSDDPLQVEGPALVLEQDQPASADVTVTVVINMDSVTSLGFTPLPGGSFTTSSLQVVIPKGETKSEPISINFAKSSDLDPTIVYGIGLVITAATEGIVPVTNSRSIVCAFNIKNKYDGVYRLRGFHSRTSPNYSAPYDEEVEMRTSGPNSVAMWWGYWGDYGHPIAGGAGSYSGMTANFTFNSDDVLTAWDWSPYPTSFATTVDPTSNSRYDANTKTIYFRGWYNNNPVGRSFTDTLTYIGPRE